MIKVKRRGWQGWLALGVIAIIALQGLGLLAAEGLYLVKVAQDVTAPDYSYDTMLAREIDLEFLRICQVELPEDARVLSLVEENAAIRYYLYPRYAVHLQKQGCTDERILRNIVARQITHVLVWDPTIYQDSRLLKDERLFEAQDYGGDQMILTVKSTLLLTEP
ncbi:MAG TPA: hypothetical protein VJG32_05065 [Anaerolineae bacterium]|nr:hypothetical protein [Anaerolineae bacterium]